jgi:hypothetical protein
MRRGRLGVEGKFRKMHWLDVLAGVTVAGWLWTFWPLFYGLIWPRRLEAVRIPASLREDAPLVSIIVPARDEAAAIEPALRSLLALDYPRFEIIAIDDRSTDDTGRIMDRVAATDGRCTVVHVSELPPGWLGKNHANAIGAARARGASLLFTDGDVQFAPEALSGAIAAMQRGGVDHLAVVPDPMMTTFGEQLLMNYFLLQFGSLTRMWITRFRWAHRSFVGIGAFNLIRRDAYERIGGHELLRMEVADDLMLGKLVKDEGLRQDVLMGISLVRVKWQTGLAGFVRGLEKNAFAGARYSVALVVIAVLVQLALALGPIVLTFTGPARAGAAALLAVVTFTHLLAAWRGGYHLLAGLLHPLASVIFCYILLQSVCRTLREGGVRWRGTFYPLAELRAGMIEWHPLGGLLRGRRSIVRSHQECGPAPR